MSAPEIISIANVYLANGMDTDKTCTALDLPKDQVLEMLHKKEVRRYIQHSLTEIGYNNRLKLDCLLDNLIESKIEEAQETGIMTTKDLADLIALKHKMSLDNERLAQDRTPHNQTNIQVNHGYETMMEKLLK